LNNYFRSEKLTRLARDQPCMFNIPGVCNGRTDTTVWCHSNNYTDGKGARLKAHDCFGAFGCFECHRWYDQGPAPKKEKQEAFELAFRNTILFCWTNGLFSVS
jgi:hypothetical protein